MSDANLTPADATAKLDGLMKDSAWSTSFLAGGPAQMTEYRNLSEIASRSDDGKIALAMNGTYLPVNDSEHFTRMGAASMLREAGLTDEVVKQALTGQPVSQAEYDAASKRKAALMRDQDWTKKMMAKNGPEYQEYQLLNVVLNAPVKDAAA